MKSEYLLLGTVIKAQGTRGEMKVKPFTDSVDRFMDLGEVWVKRESMTPYAVTGARVTADMAFIQIKGIEDRTQAEQWRGTDLYVHRNRAVRLEPDQWFIVDLIGCRVEDESGAVIGTIADVLQPGGHDVYVVRADSESILIPAVRVLVRSVDIDRGIVTVDRERFEQMAVWE